MSPNSRPILLTGGGTGGHVYPALAVAQAVRASEPGAQFVYVGVKGGIEESIADKNGIPFRAVSTAPFPGLRSPLKLLKFAAKVMVGTLQATAHLLFARPKALVATGGYVAAPAVFAAVVLRTLRILPVRIFVHEQNASPGRLNRLVARFADVVGVSFLGTEGYLPGAPTRYVGYPVRPALRASLDRDADAALPEVLRDIPAGRTIVLAFGGSQGARTVNRAVVDALQHLQDRDDLYIIHGVGRRQRSGYDPESDVATRLAGLSLTRDLTDFYRSVPYIDDIGAAYEAASFVICRGGAGTVKEICAVGRASILMPKAGLAGDHQVMNALVLEQADAGVVLLEEPTVDASGLLPAVPGKRLADAMQELLDAPERVEAMGQAALALDDPEAMGRILTALDGTNGSDAKPALSETAQRPEIKLAELGPAGVLGYVRRWRQAHEDDAISEIPGYAYLQYRAASMMTAGAWRVRNIGVKLAGVLRLTSLIGLLRYLFEDPTPAGRLARLVGGDRRQNGFIRRNTCASLIQIGVVDEDVEAIVRQGVNDSYWEVRREACHAIRRLGPPICNSAESREAVVRLLGDRSFEVRIASIRAIGDRWTLEEGLPLLRPFYMDENWQIREAVLRAFDTWAVGASEETLTVLRAEFDNVLLTAGGYRPLFGLKESARRVSNALAEGNGKPAEGASP